MMNWILKQQYFREDLQFGSGGDTGPVNDMLRHTMERSGANIMGKRMVRVSGGANVIQQYLSMGVIDELEIALAPVLFGGGRRLFEDLTGALPQFRIDRVLDTPDATHLRYVYTGGSSQSGRER